MPDLKPVSSRKPGRSRRIAALALAIGAPVLLWRLTGAPPVIDAVTGATSPPPNSAPVLRLKFQSNAPKRASPRTVDVGETLTITVTGKDPNGDFVELGQSSLLPPGASWTGDYGNPATGRLVWTPRPGATDWTARFWATDSPAYGNTPLTTSQNVTIHVGTNTPPVLDSIVSPQVVKAGKTLKLVITASDADGDVLKFLSQNLPAGAKLSAATFTRGKYRTVLTWKPGRAQAGQSFTATITVQDDYPNPHQDSADVTLTVGP